MFNWFRPSCPVDPHAKKWIENRLQWLSNEFGHDVFSRRAVILPLEEFFPDPYDATDAAGRVLLNRVCSYMDADPSKVVLEFYTDRSQTWLVNAKGDAIARPAGLYQEESGYYLIKLERSQLGE